MSLVGALTPLVKVAHKYWVRAALAYSFAGSVSALFVGELLGWVGHLLRADRVRWVIIPLALLLAIRGLGWVHFQLPERKRQTEKAWAHEFGFVMASAMWGFDVGLGLTTYIGNGSFWVLALTALGIGKPSFAAMLMLGYWSGRVIPVWVMPVVWRIRETDDVITAILATRSIYKRSEAMVLIWSAGILIIWLLQSGDAQAYIPVIGHMR